MSTGKVYQVWSTDMVQCLLSKIRLLWPKFQDGKYTMKMLYEDASTNLCEAGYDMTPYRVEKKWHNLVTTYRNVLSKKHTYGDEAVTRKHEYFEELHEIMGNMSTVRGKSNIAPIPSLTHTQPLSPSSPQSAPPSPASSPEPKRKRPKVEDIKQTQIILVPNVQGAKNTHQHHHRHPQQQQPVQPQQPQRKFVSVSQSGAEDEREARREWREWKRQQEMLSIQREGNRVLESIDENLAAIRKSLEFIVEKLSNQ